jgi:hypothetical protein
MAKTTRKKVAAEAGRQAPTGAWSPAMLLDALKSGTDADRRKALEKAGIIDARGNLTQTYKNWGTKVTRTPEAPDADA